jgi:hypothetical protein
MSDVDFGSPERPSRDRRSVRESISTADGEYHTLITTVTLNSFLFAPSA